MSLRSMSISSSTSSSFNPETGVFVLTPPESLKYPEAHNFLDLLKFRVELEEGSQFMTSLILDFQNVEYLDFTGLQSLLQAKDFLSQHVGGRHVPIFFVNMSPNHMSRLMRVTAYIPGHAADPSLMYTTPSRRPSLTRSASPASSAAGSVAGSPAMESLPEPPTLVLRTRSSSKLPRLTTLPSTPPHRKDSAGPFPSPSSTLPLSSTRSRSDSNPIPPNAYIRRDSAFVAQQEYDDGQQYPPQPFPTAPIIRRDVYEPPKEGVDMAPSVSIGSFLKKLKSKAKEVEVVDNDVEDPFRATRVTGEEFRRVIRANEPFGVQEDEFPRGFGKELRYFHSSLEEAVGAASVRR